MKPYKNIKRGGVTYSEHKWIYEQAYGPVPEGYVVHHINHKKRDNRIENLTLMTHQMHSEHHNQVYPKVKACAMCGMQFEPHPTKRKRAVTCSDECFRARMAESRRKVGAEQISAMRSMREGGVILKDIAREFGVSLSTVHRLTSGEAA